MNQVLLANIWLEFESIRGTLDYKQDWLSKLVQSNLLASKSDPPAPQHWSTTRPFQSKEELHAYSTVPPAARSETPHPPEVRGLFASYDVLVAFSDFVAADTALVHLDIGTTIGRIIREDDGMFLMEIRRQV
jgi:hypothetical protein